MSKRKTLGSKAKPAAQLPLAVHDFGTPWTACLNLHVDGLISWRNYVAIALRDIAIDDVLAGLVPIIAEMERLTTERILGVHAENPEAFVSFNFYAWRPAWQDHFQHWQDPVRQLLSELCVKPDARFLADRLHVVDGQVLLDFLLAPCNAQCRLAWQLGLAESPLHPDSPISMIDPMQPGRMLEQMCIILYNRFAEIAPFATIAAPAEVSLDLSYDRLCPEEMPWNKPDGPGEDASC